MVVEETRPMNDAERTVLAEHARGPRPPTSAETARGVLGVLAVPATLAGIGWAAVALVGHPAVLPSLVCVGGVSIFAAYFVWMALSAHFHWGAVAARHARDDRARYERALEVGLVDVRRIEAASVTVLEPDEDEGGAYVFDVGGGRVLLIKGQWAEHAELGGKWPSLRFEIVRARTAAADGGETMHVGIFSAADEAVPLRALSLGETLEGSPMEAAFDEHDALVEGSIDDAIDRVRKRVGVLH